MYKFSVFYRTWLCWKGPFVAVCIAAHPRTLRLIWAHELLPCSVFHTHPLRLHYPLSGPRAAVYLLAVLEILTQTSSVLPWRYASSYWSERCAASFFFKKKFRLFFPRASLFLFSRLTWHRGLPAVYRPSSHFHIWIIEIGLWFLINNLTHLPEL